MSITVAGSGLIYRNAKPHVYSRHGYFPSLAVLPDGRIFAGFDIGSAFEAADVRSFYAVSADGGTSWSEPQRVPLPEFEKPFSCSCRFGVSREGTLVGVGALWDRSRSEEGLASEVTGGFAETYPFLIRADGNSLAWGEPQWLEAPLAGPFEICSPVFFAEDGTWLWPASTWKDWNGEAPEGMLSVLLRSHDAGRTWTEWNAVMDGRDAGVVHWETKLVALRDGRLLAVAWTHDTKAGVDLPIQYAISGDGGRTFSKPQSTGLQGQTCTPVVLADGRVLCVYRRKDRTGLWAQVAEISGDAWKNGEEEVLWGGSSHLGANDGKSTMQQMSALRFGLPAVKMLDERTALVAFWCVEDAVSVIRYFRLSV